MQFLFIISITERQIHINSQVVNVSHVTDLFSSKISHLTLCHLSLTATKPSSAIEIYADPEAVVENGTTGILRCTFKSNVAVGSKMSFTWNFQSSNPDNQYSNAPLTVSVFSIHGIYFNQCWLFCCFEFSHTVARINAMLLYLMSRDRKSRMWLWLSQLSDDFLVVIIGINLYGFFLHAFIIQLKLSYQ